MTPTQYYASLESFKFVTIKRYRNFSEFSEILNVLPGWCIYRTTNNTNFDFCAFDKTDLNSTIMNLTFAFLNVDNVRMIWQDYDLRIRVKTEEDLVLLKLLT